MLAIALVQDVCVSSSLEYLLYNPSNVITETSSVDAPLRYLANAKGPDAKAPG